MNVLDSMDLESLIQRAKNNDPTALEHLVLAHGELWIDEHLYSVGMTNPMIAERAKAQGLTRADKIIADSAEPKSIAEINATGGLHVRPTKKGADSVRAGLQILTRYPLRVTRRSVGLIKELKSYKWKEDRDGNQLNEPIDKFNHAIDALRYYALECLKEQRPTKYRATIGDTTNDKYSL